ncbi:MAG: hypothetical protein ACT4QA_03890 [Panacagrimonas sp.]
MRLRFRHQVIFALALLLGQWLNLAHAYEHPALSADLHCEICLHAQGLDSGAVAAALSDLSIPPPIVDSRVPAVRAAHVRHVAPCSIRGPPRSKV